MTNGRNASRLAALALGLAAALPPGAGPAAAQDRPASGRYTFARIGQRPLPQYFEDLWPGRGFSVRSGTLELHADGGFSARILLYLVEPGRRIIDTLVAEGRWEPRADSVALTYSWWRTQHRTRSPTQTAMGRLRPNTLDLAEFGFLNARIFGIARRLRFERTR